MRQDGMRGKMTWQNEMNRNELKLEEKRRRKLRWSKLNWNELEQMRWDGVKSLNWNWSVFYEIKQQAVNWNRDDMRWNIIKWTVMK